MPEDPKLERFDPAPAVCSPFRSATSPRKTTVDQLAKFLVDPLKVVLPAGMPSLT
jgi:hypothetical protein